MEVEDLIGQRVIVRRHGLYIVGTLQKYPRRGEYKVCVRNGANEARVTFVGGDVDDINGYEIRIKK